MRHFNIGTPVLARNYGRRDLWSKGVVSKQTGQVSYQVQVGTSTWRRHPNQLRRSELPITETMNHRFLKKTTQNHSQMFL